MARLAVTAVFDSPVREASGLCTFDLDGVEHLAVVGDKDLTLAHGPVGRAGVPDQWRVLNLDHCPGMPDDAGQFEAVADAGSGRLLILGEEPAVVILLEVATCRVAAVWHLDVSDDEELRKLWNRDPNSRGEGLIPGSGGRLLVIKETDPVVAVEFAPSAADTLEAGTFPVAGSWQAPEPGRLVPDHWSALEPAPADISDCTPVGDRLLALSDQDACIAELTRNDGRWVVGERQRLAKSVRKPEGLAVPRQGVTVVAMDRRELSGALVTVDRPDLPMG